MGLRDLRRYGLLLPRILWGRLRLHASWRSELLSALSLALGVASCVLMYLGSGHVLTWIGLAVFLVFLGAMLATGLYSIERRSAAVDEAFSQLGKEEAEEAEQKADERDPL